MIPERAEGYRLRALEQAAAMLRAFGPETPELRLSELAERAGQKEAAAQRIVRNLEAAGLLECAPSGSYRLGLELWRLGALALRARDLWGEVEPALRALAAASGATPVLAVLDGGEAVYIEQVLPGRALGRPFPAHATALGKALLAELPLDRLREAVSERALEPCTPRTITEAGALDAELALTRERGYALEDEEFSPRLRAIGAPIRDHEGRALAALGVRGATSELTRPRLAESGERVAAAARSLSARLGAGALMPLRLEVERGEGGERAVVARRESGAAWPSEDRGPSAPPASGQSSPSSIAGTRR